MNAHVSRCTRLTAVPRRPTGPLKPARSPACGGIPRVHSPTTAPFTVRGAAVPASFPTFRRPAARASIDGGAAGAAAPAERGAAAGGQPAGATREMVPARGAARPLARRGGGEGMRRFSRCDIPRGPHAKAYWAGVSGAGMALAVALPERLVNPPRKSREERLDMIGRSARAELLPPLARFIKYLASKGLMEFGPPLADGMKGVDVIDRVQQYAYTALYFGLDMGFDFDMYINGGPAAYEMADAVYRLSDEDGAVYGAAEPDMPASFRGGEFLGMVEGRSKAWISAATTLLCLSMNGRWDLGRLRNRALELIPCSPEIVDDALGEIKRRGMLR